MGLSASYSFKDTTFSRYFEIHFTYMTNNIEHVAFFLPDLQIGGAEKVFIQLLNEFSVSHFKVDLLLSQDVGEFRHLVNNNIEIISFCTKAQSKPVLFLSSLRGLFFYVRKYRPKAIYSTLTGANVVSLLVSLAHHFLDTKFIIREANVNKNNGLMYKCLSKLLYKRAHRVVAVSEGVKRDLIKSLGVSASKIVVIKNPVDIERVREMAMSERADPWINEERSAVIVSVGRLFPQKDFETLIKAFKLVREQNAAKLVIIGEGPERDKLERLVAMLKLENYVKLVGVKTNPFVYLNNADVFVQSSKWEGFPNVLLEALAVGVPIVATDCHSGPAEILNGINGCSLVPVGDERSMADAILREFEQPTDTVQAETRLSEFSIASISGEYKKLLK
mgnify:CR=1 FL=1